MIPEQFEAEIIERAKRGDQRAGIEAIRLCIVGLDSGSLSPQLASYLADCLQGIADGLPVERALCLEVERPRGAPPNPMPDWEKPLAAMAALLQMRGYRPEVTNRAMSDARTKTSGKSLDPKEARRLRKTYSPMKDWTEPDLLHLCGSAIGEILKQFPPTKTR